MKVIKVALASEQDRYQTVFKALDLIFPDICHHIYTLNQKKDYILIKPNCIVTNRQAAVTHIDALRAVMDFLQPLWQGKIIIAEGAGLGSTMEAFKNFHYLDLKNSFPNLEFLDINFSDSISVEAVDENLKLFQIRISGTVVEAPFRISVGPPKTHDSVIVSLSIKNMAVGSILKEDKAKIHQGPKAINKTIANINQYTYPHLAIVDGWVSMEGNGPVEGEKIETNFAIASANALAADIFCCERMGFNPLQIGYLNFLGAGEFRNLIQAVGKNPQDFTFHFKYPDDYLDQIVWN